MTEFWEDDPEKLAELERLALATYHRELEQRGGIGAEVERLSWARRLREALKDGVEVAGPKAVHEVLAPLVKEFGIKGSKGRPPEPLTVAQLAAARRAAELIASGGKIEHWRLARTAKMTPEAFSYQFAFPKDGRGGGARWVDFWSEVAAFDIKDEPQ
jgi:hypothetical protein